MKNLACLLLAGMSLIAAGCTPTAYILDESESGAEIVYVLMQTELGDIQIAVEVERAPVTAANFLRYVDEGFYDGGRFHRTVHLENQPDNEIKIEVVQGSSLSTRERRGYPAIPLERTNATGLQHLDGAISMARNGPDTATSDFFICINDQPSLDFGGLRNADGQGFAAFGRVTMGMDVVSRIHASPTNERRTQNLDPPIGIIKVTRLK